jgi:type II secretory pathway pseudopilin PulG
MKKALTIGELLVTMAIIGIIAMLVLPGFLKDYHNKLYVTHLKRVYEMIEIAINQACIDNNVSYFYQTPYATTGVKNQEFLDKYFKKAKTVNEFPFADKYVTMNTGEASELSLGTSNTYAWTKLVGGEAMAYTCSSSNACYFAVDINSNDEPNVGGRDLFRIFINASTNRVSDNYGSSICGTDNKGSGCLAKIIENNWEMNY